ncbi:MAG: hypothetical protein HKN23_05790 [Verrucomicrobiales bacterium]|nr:hypothetical protein [Verrucomicrobiales bacterium]
MRNLLLTSLIGLCFPFAAITANGAESIDAPTLSQAELHAYEFTIPGPRGLIVDRAGRPLAKTVVEKRLGLFLPSLFSEVKPDGNEAKPLPVSRVLEQITELETSFPQIEFTAPTPAQVQEHWKNRRYLPLVISQPIPTDSSLLDGSISLPAFLKVESRYQREYPEGEAFAHITGYVRPSMPEQYGPLRRKDLKWPSVVSATGLEANLNEKLTGTDGEVNLLIDKGGNVMNREFAKRPRPGFTVVTTLDLEMQNLAYRLLKDTGRPGAFVAVDARSGDILAMATYPSFNPNQFVDGISETTYRELAGRPDAPLFSRAFQGAYPPGSTFKPIVALAAMDAGAVYGTSTRFQATPYVEIDGRKFHNWNDDHEGLLDVRYALLRSSNTWFYQAGLRTGAGPILRTSLNLGLGKKPDIPLSNVAAGNIPDPDQFMVRQGIANLSIGQGDVLVSPVQLASAMGAIAAGRDAKRARIVSQIQDFKTHTPVRLMQAKRAWLNYREGDLYWVHAGMWGVVNHKAGTGKAAAVDGMRIYGKTGTAQWSSDGERKPLVWFSGFSGHGDPQVAFAVMLEGKPGEVIYGGKNAAPVAGEFLNAVFADPAKYGVDFSKDPPRPQLKGSVTAIPEYTQQRLDGVVIPNRDGTGSNPQRPVAEPIGTPSERYQRASERAVAPSVPNSHLPRTPLLDRVRNLLNR